MLFSTYSFASLFSLEKSICGLHKTAETSFIDHIAEVPIWAKYSCIDFLDPKSGILELFGFLLPNFSTKMVFFYAFWRAAVKNQNKTIQLDFRQIRLY